ncbi:MAG: hypothetical protein AB8B94_08525 [Hyphomicrobiales bacterium]
MQFATAKAVLAFLALLGWGLSALGAIAFLYVFTQVGFLQALSAVVIVAMGVFIVATSQMGLAQIATAENTKALLDVVRSGKVDLGTKPISQNTYSTPSTSAPKKAGDRVKVFKGREILKAETGVSVDGNNFGNVLEAEKWINGQSG